MEHRENLLTAAEWHLMECLWEKSPRTGREATEYLERCAGWSRSTTLTMLRRMTEKRLIACGEEDGVFLAEENATYVEGGTYANCNRVCATATRYRAFLFHSFDPHTLLLSKIFYFEPPSRRYELLYPSKAARP